MNLFSFCLKTIVCLFGLFAYFFTLVKAEPAVEVTEPRQFGYVLGDKIERIFVVILKKNW